MHASLISVSLLTAYRPLQINFMFPVLSVVLYTCRQVHHCHYQLHGRLWIIAQSTVEVCVRTHQKSACSACHRRFVGLLGIAAVFTNTYTTVPSSTNMQMNNATNGSECLKQQRGYSFGYLNLKLHAQLV